MTSARRVGSRLVTLMMTAMVIVGVALVVLVAVRQRQTPETTRPSSDAVTGVIEWVIDGDTVDITFGDQTERVRLIGVDTPEIKHEATDERPGNEADCFGDEATDFIKSLIPPGTPVRVDRDVVARDDYGRLLGYVFRADDEIFVNFELLHQGYARPLSIRPNTTYQAIFADAARQAEQADLGLWTACN